MSDGDMQSVEDHNFHMIIERLRAAKDIMAVHMLEDFRARAHRAEQALNIIRGVLNDV
jgi:hypothetical protein